MTQIPPLWWSRRSGYWTVTRQAMMGPDEWVAQIVTEYRRIAHPERRSDVTAFNEFLGLYYSSDGPIPYREFFDSSGTGISLADALALTPEDTIRKLKALDDRVHAQQRACAGRRSEARRVERTIRAAAALADYERSDQERELAAMEVWLYYRTPDEARKNTRDAERAKRSGPFMNAFGLLYIGYLLPILALATAILIRAILDPTDMSVQGTMEKLQGSDFMWMLIPVANWLVLAVGLLFDESGSRLLILACLAGWWIIGEIGARRLPG